MSPYHQESRRAVSVRGDRLGLPNYPRRRMRASFDVSAATPIYSAFLFRTVSYTSLFVCVCIRSPTGGFSAPELVLIGLDGLSKFQGCLSIRCRVWVCRRYPLVRCSSRVFLANDHGCSPWEGGGVGEVNVGTQHPVDVNRRAEQEWMCVRVCVCRDQTRQLNKVRNDRTCPAWCVGRVI